VGWDDVIGVDFTRTAQSVQRTGADLQKWAKQQETKATIFIIKNITIYLTFHMIIHYHAR
jgi:hypothetical protein